MARRKSAKQIAASRRNIRKAQKASARLRLAQPNKLPTAAGMARRPRISATTRRRVAIGAVAAVAVGAAGYQANYHRKYVTGYHRTSHANAAKIVKTNSFVSKTETRNKVPVEGSHTQIWFDKKKNGPAKNFGPAIVKVRKIPRSALTTHTASMMQHAARQKDPRAAEAMRNKAGHVKSWVAVETHTLKGLKAQKVRQPMRAILPGPSRALDKLRQDQLKFTTGPGGATHMNYLVSNWEPKAKKLKKRRR